MKYYLFSILLAALILIPELAMAGPERDFAIRELKPESVDPSLTNNQHRTKQETKGKQSKMLVITEAKVIPLMQFLGLPDVNNLEPTSAGPTEN